LRIGRDVRHGRDGVAKDPALDAACLELGLAQRFQKGRDLGFELISIEPAPVAERVAVIRAAIG